MIVDLLRNDLGRIAAPGTIRWSKVFEPERFETVWQLTSTVTARIRPETGLADVFRALFPSGSITGAPKVRTMRIIADLEDSPRGVYCGAVGYLAPASAGPPSASFNVAIRTVTIDAETGTAEYGVDYKMHGGIINFYGGYVPSPFIIPLTIIHDGVPKNKTVVINLAPGDLKKEATAFDLPIAVGILAAGFAAYLLWRKARAGRS